MGCIVDRSLHASEAAYDRRDSQVEVLDAFYEMHGYCMTRRNFDYRIVFFEHPQLLGFFVTEWTLSSSGKASDYFGSYLLLPPVE